jgi:hypothetical protein
LSTHETEPLSPYEKVVSLYVGYRRDQKFEGARNIKFRQVRTTESVIPYILCVVWIDLGVDRGDLRLEGSLSALI